MSVAPCPPGFLKVGFYGIGQVHVDDDAHVRLVYSHAESVGGHHDAAPAGLPAVLADVFGGIVQSGMVEVGCYVFVVQQFGDFFGTSAVAHVHDGAAGHAAQDVQQFAGLVVGLADNVGKVAPFKAHAENVLPAEMQAGLDVFHYFRGGGGGQGQNGDVRQQFTYFCDFR